MRPLLSWISKEGQYEYDEILKMYMRITVFDEDERDIQNLCFETVLVEIRRDHVIFEQKKLLLNGKRLIRS